MAKVIWTSSLDVSGLRARLRKAMADEGGLAQLARAPALHAGGQRFESVILHKYFDWQSCQLGY